MRKKWNIPLPYTTTLASLKSPYSTIFLLSSWLVPWIWLQVTCIHEIHLYTLIFLIISSSSLVFANMSVSEKWKGKPNSGFEVALWHQEKLISYPFVSCVKKKNPTENTRWKLWGMTELRVNNIFVQYFCFDILCSIKLLHLWSQAWITSYIRVSETLVILLSLNRLSNQLQEWPCRAKKIRFNSSLYLKWPFWQRTKLPNTSIIMCHQYSDSHIQKSFNTMFLYIKLGGSVHYLRLKWHLLIDIYKSIHYLQR